MGPKGVLLTAFAFLGASALAGCRRSHERDVITVFNAGSLAVPLRAVLDSFARRTHVRIDQENAGSLETARKLTEFHRIPDVIALADVELFPKMLEPTFVDGYTPFARNRLGLLYTDRSRGADSVSSANWFRVTMQPGVAVGRSDPTLDPAGYRTLIAFRLAEEFYGIRGLADSLEVGAPARYVRPKSADLVALLQTGNIDYAWGYESVARAAHLRFLKLPSEIDLSNPADSARYGAVTIRVPGASLNTLIEIRGTPIVFGIAVPKHPPHGNIGEQFVTYLLSRDGQMILKAHGLETLP